MVSVTRRRFVISSKVLITLQHCISNTSITFEAHFRIQPRPEVYDRRAVAQTHLPRLATVHRPG